MTDEDAPANASDGALEEQQERGDRAAGRPAIAGAIGLLAGLAGGIVGTTIGPANPIVSLPLVVLVVLGVTTGTLRVLRR